MSEHYDVVIAGGGLVGAALACALGGQGRRVAVLEARPPAPAGPGADTRVSALTPATRRLLERLGAWERLPQARIGPFRRMRVWDAAGSGEIGFDAAELGEPALGWIVENGLLQAALTGRLQEHDGIELLCPAPLATLDREVDGLRLGLAGGRMLRARLLVGADGAGSKVRSLAGIETMGWGYDQAAVVATVRTSRPHQQTAWQRFLPAGPLAFLPLADGGCSIVWSTSPQHADRLVALAEPRFAEVLAEAFDWRLGAVEEVGPRASFPLRLLHARRYVAPRIALAGDAAHVVHPLAGQGVNLGFLDAAALAQVLAGARDPGAYRDLRRYERWRKGDNLLMQATLDGLKRLFGSSLPPLRWLRNAGLDLTDAAGPVKHLLARHAMGLAGDLPLLARGP